MRSVGLWLVRVGCLLLVLAALLFVGVGDFLPVDLWLWIHHLWSGTGAHSYVRVVPGPQFQVVEWSLVVAGVAAIAAGSVLRSRGNQQ